MPILFAGGTSRNSYASQWAALREGNVNNAVVTAHHLAAARKAFGRKKQVGQDETTRAVDLIFETLPPFVRSIFAQGLGFGFETLDVWFKLIARCTSSSSWS